MQARKHRSVIPPGRHLPSHRGIVSIRIPAQPFTVVGTAGFTKPSRCRLGASTSCARLLESDVDAAARGVFECLFGLVSEAIASETVKRET